ncbi:hypothetical protein Pelo_19729 [Pelomyxa schiedti]|nr:hypothetical protein Pelo_19729 [Pelomyxa schiedti]
MDSNHINFEEQVVALLTASHPRCGRDSAAGLLSYHTNQPLIRQIVGNKWRLGHVVIQLKTRNRGGSCGLSLAVGVSMSTLGVACTTETMRKYYVSGVAWIDSRHYLAHGPDPAVVSAECGARVVVPGMDKSTQMSLVCKGKWMVDHAVWKVWRVEVGVDGSGVDRMTVSQPRTVTQCFESDM